MKPQYLIIIGLLIAINIGIFVYYSSNKYDYNCLENYAKSYCNEKGLDHYYEAVTYFFCQSENPRIGKSYTRFYFLESEIDSCKTKESYSFKSLK